MPGLGTGAGVELLRFTTAGSVDDGKSTLIGRLLHDTRSVFQDQLAHIEGASRRRGRPSLDLALLTDGLRDEREQGITIDVAYRYFQTARRRFIIADTPGHLQYTRNMVTGASTADLAVILIDASRGILTQSRRHAFLSSLLGIPQLVVAVNKMDLVGFREEAFQGLCRRFEAFAVNLEEVERIAFVPISALEGDGVVTPSRRMPWYRGPTLLQMLEGADTGTRSGSTGLRFPVQTVLRARGRFRGYAGTVRSGEVRPGDPVTVHPSGWTTRIRSVETPEGPRERAGPGEPVVLTVQDELDIGRGDLMSAASDAPLVAPRLSADLCWMDRRPLRPGREYLLLMGTRQVRVRIERIVHRVEIDTLGAEGADALALNEIGRVELGAAEPIAFDPYRENPATGSFVLVDPETDQTSGAGMAREARERPRAVSPGAVWEEEAIPREAREARHGHAAGVVWLTGISGAGKSTIARETEQLLFGRGVSTALLDGDRLRHGLCGDLGFSPADRAENLRRAGEVARILFDHGHLVLAAFISPSAEARARARALLPAGRFVEVHVDAPVALARRRDPKGLYGREAAGVIDPLPGSRGPWEPPTNPELTLDTTRLDPTAAARRIVRHLEAAGLLSPPRSAEEPSPAAEGVAGSDLARPEPNRRERS